jgi:N-acetyl-gamma-glutamylphosphate reductase
MRRCEQIWYKAKHATDDNINNMAHAFYMLDNKAYRHTLRICNAYCFSTTKIMRTSINIKLYVQYLIT